MHAQAAQAYSLYFVWELWERAIYKTLYGNLPVEEADQVLLQKNRENKLTRNF